MTFHTHVLMYHVGFGGVASFDSRAANFVMPTFPAGKDGKQEYLPHIVNTVKCYGIEKELGKCVLKEFDNYLADEYIY